MTTLKIENYSQLLAMDTTVFETICDGGDIDASAVAKQSVVFTDAEYALLQAAHDWYEVYGTLPVWLPEEWWRRP